MGKPAHFTVDTSEAGTVKPVEVKCYDIDGTTLAIDTKMLSNKTSTYQYKPIKKGKHMVSVTYGGVPIQNSPFMVMT